MERIVRFFVERHLLVNVLTLAVVVLGIGTMMRTNIEGFPEASLPRFIITATLPGASARDVETKLTIPIEDETAAPPSEGAAAETTPPADPPAEGAAGGDGG